MSVVMDSEATGTWEAFLAYAANVFASRRLQVGPSFSGSSRGFGPWPSIGTGIGTVNHRYDLGKRNIVARSGYCRRVRMGRVR